ncbi:hypothetical protein CONPUDRAFT_163158 [Coniophora puteana RWD-64-598 SS2]|uniref:Sodium/calcium exchanger membrane region domain-containing protein n=1 Tax=Coniophora puteana (strain RWD-64-598) TaxID=741705 RepID=A0A5M3MXY6_CONPW|nr:uncharacterized protein CONPUDRAFT_163158 [Coniophora puteana RWD-64-598 SS2]EIW83896.1 hypothetical protein CONPUDRAFT_163158 [Coniophora puteana RWD-64-598 SS2]
MANGAARLLFVAALVINVVLWSHSRHTQFHSETRSIPGLLKRSLDDLAVESICEPLAHDSSAQCAHVTSVCPSSETVLSIPYLQLYFCASLPSRPFLFAALLTWLAFLFSTLGIAASDFFTPNLASLASLLGLDENVAGVTFLAFGNASPDVFSTFSALHASAGGLALGELLGAASFIVSVVVGAMALVRPFRVPRAPFFRDVGFFAAAVITLLAILWDGHLHAWEAGFLAFLYVIYATVVIVGSWWTRRRERRRLREMLARAEYGEEDAPVLDAYDDDRNEPTITPLTLVAPTPSRLRALSAPSPPGSLLQPPARGQDLSASTPGLTLQTHFEGSRSPSRTPSPAPLSAVGMPSFSLVRALEFREVVASLRDRAAAPGLAAFDRHNSIHSHSTHTGLVAGHSPLTPGSPLAHTSGVYSHGHSPLTPSQRQSPQHAWRYPLRTGSGTERERETDPWHVALASGPDAVPLRERTPTPRVELSVPEDVEREGELSAEESVDGGELERSLLTVRDEAFHRRSPSPPTIPSLPSIAHTPASPHAPHLPDTEHEPPASFSLSIPSSPSKSKSGLTTREQIVYALKGTYRVLCPSLQRLRHKTLIAQAASILAAPAMLALTLTLPVVVLPPAHELHEKPAPGAPQLPDDADMRLTAPPRADGSPPGDIEQQQPRPHLHRRSRSQRSHLGVPGSPVSGRSGGTGNASASGREYGAYADEAEEIEAERAMLADAEEAMAHAHERGVDGEMVMHEGQFNRWLVAAQCTCGPLFCLVVLFNGSSALPWLLVAAAVAGVAVGSLVIAFGHGPDAGTTKTARMVRCAAGFAVAIVWIMAIADEVVNVLRTFGFIFGLSDAIIGLTIFAIGNSLADLVANTSVAVFAPIMGFSACFGGPMLNILLGIGLSGLYVTSADPTLNGGPLQLPLTPTLLSSALGLLVLLGATLVWVPLHGFWISRMWGAILVGAYAVLMAVNVLVELKFDDA